MKSLTSNTHLHVSNYINMDIFKVQYNLICVKSAVKHLTNQPAVGLHWMWPSSVYILMFSGLCVYYDHALCQNGGTEQDSIWRADSHVLKELWIRWECTSAPPGEYSWSLWWLRCGDVVSCYLTAATCFRVHIVKRPQIIVSIITVSTLG